MITKNKKDLNKVFEKLFEILKTPTFQRCEGLNGEIPFFAQTFSATQQVVATEQIDLLLKRLKAVGISVTEINLYKICIELLEKEDVLQNVLETEHELSKSDFHEALNGLLNIETELIPVIKDKINAQETAMIFITGVGEAYPMIRSHTLLSNLQAVIKKKPVILFFPGEFDNFSLKLFGILKNENYYRAFNLDEFKQN
jgi:hypothetical protein